MSDESKKEKARLATAKYKAAHRDELNAKYRERLANDPEFRERRRAQVNASVAKWKALHPETAISKSKRHYRKFEAKYREIARAYYHAHKEERRAYSKRRYLSQRDEVLADLHKRGQVVKAETMVAYGGACCACCGELRLPFLTIDHIDGCGTARRRQEGSGTVFYRYLKKASFPAGYRVLCFNCNCGRRVNGGKCPHEDERTHATFSA